MATEKLGFGDLSADDVFTAVTKKGLTPSQASSFVGEWLLVNQGRARRVFNYTQEFPATDADCKSSFARTFQHDDWIDGESAVQAGKTPEEQGFNERFHRIEADLDALGKDVALAFTCLAEMRRDLRNLLDEIRVEINRLNADTDPVFKPPITNFPLQTNPSIFGGGSFLGKFKINESPMQLWQTSNGMVMLPDLETLAGPIWSDPRTQRAAQFNRFLEENGNVKATFPADVTKEDLIKKFGNERLQNGQLVRELLAIVPDGAKFANLDALGNEITERETAALRTTPGVRDAAALTLGVTVQAGAKLDTAPVDRLDTLSTAARSALARNGIDTVGKLAGLSTAKVSEILAKERVGDVRTGDIAEAIGVAKSISRL